MAHQMLRGGEPCALPDDHWGPHRSVAGLARYRESQARYSASPEAREARDRWKAANPVQDALSDLRTNAARRGRDRSAK